MAGHPTSHLRRTFEQISVNQGAQGTNAEFYQGKLESILWDQTM
jgi:hypothetical protein